MGNQVSEGRHQMNKINSLTDLNNSNNQNCDESEVNQIVSSIVADLIDSVLLQESIMDLSKEVAQSLSLNKNKNQILNTILTQNESTVEMDETIDNRFYETAMDMDITTTNASDMDISVLTEKFSPLDSDSKIQMSGIDLSANQPFGESPHSDQREVLNINTDENELNESVYISPQRTSPASDSSYSNPSRVSPTPATTALSDWKYISNGYTTTDDKCKTDGPQFNTISNSWEYKNPINCDLKPGVTRISLYRQFDPMFNKEEDSDTKMLKVLPEKHIDTNGEHNWFKINENLNCVDSNGHFKSAKPDVLAFAIEDSNEDNNKDSYQKYDEKLKEKDIMIEDMKEKLSAMQDKNEGLLKLIETFHNINEELVKTSSQALLKKDNEVEKLKADRAQALEDVNVIEKNFSDLHLRYDKLRHDFKLCKESENSYQQKYMSSKDRINDLENICKDLESKTGENKYSEKSMKEIQNQLIAAKVQNKKGEMKISFLQNQLDQKSQENMQLSAMVDELVAKV